MHDQKMLIGQAPILKMSESTLDISMSTLDDTGILDTHLEANKHGTVQQQQQQQGSACAAYAVARKRMGGTWCLHMAHGGAQWVHSRCFNGACCRGEAQAAAQANMAGLFAACLRVQSLSLSGTVMLGRYASTAVHCKCR